MPWHSQRCWPPARTRPRLPQDHDLSGLISGEWGENPKLRLNLVGAGFPQALTSRSTLPQQVSARPEDEGGWQYGVDLPGVPAAAGVYQIIAFNDINGNATYEPGEPFARNSQYLIYSVYGGDWSGFQFRDWLNIPAMSVSRGWNLYDASQPLGAGNPRAATAKLSGYDLPRGER
ncbi:hypothetical protein [Deinococcus sp. Marseille-Q6407]|uniref:hypothetical protein n=1 Tax=Deinococcus sp. Marseille-Q6407 TaxID=2969223 RepID=UPI0021C24F6F|nr:hypothetical protein [Deinococcus sp. Marseille-Q6407]